MLECSLCQQLLMSLPAHMTPVVAYCVARWYSMIGHWTRSWSLIKDCYLDIIQSHYVWQMCFWSIAGRYQGCDQMHGDCYMWVKYNSTNLNIVVCFSHCGINRGLYVWFTNSVPNNDIHSCWALNGKWARVSAAFDCFTLVWLGLFVLCETALLPNSVFYQWNTKHKILCSSKCTRLWEQAWADSIIIWLA